MGYWTPKAADIRIVDSETGEALPFHLQSNNAGVKLRWEAARYVHENGCSDLFIKSHREAASKLLLDFRLGNFKFRLNWQEHEQ